jgi:hypothetical protein
MAYDPAVIYSFCLYVLYVLLPLIPAVLIFRLFPEAKVTVSGPLQNFTINATGAFAAYIVTVALGFFLVRNAEVQINSTRHYAIEGVITDVGENQGIDSDGFYSRYTSDALGSNGTLRNRNIYFVVVLDHPVVHSEIVELKYWGFSETGGVGTLPNPNTWIQMQLLPTSSLQRFRLQIENGKPVIEPEITASAALPRS